MTATGKNSCILPVVPIRQVCLRAERVAANLSVRRSPKGEGGLPQVCGIFSANRQLGKNPAVALSELWRVKRTRGRREKEGAMEYRALIHQQYRTADPVPRFEDFEAASDEEAVGKALKLSDPNGLGFRYGMTLHAVARKENGRPDTVIFEDCKWVTKPIDPVTLRSECG